VSLERMSDTDEADRELLYQVKTSLQHRGYWSIRSLEIRVKQGIAVVQGQVPTFYMRQIAVECIKCVGGVTKIIDRIDVVYIPDDFRVTESNSGESKTSTVSSLHQVDSPIMTRAAQNKPQTDFRQRLILSPAKG